MNLDVRTPIGLLFLILGILLVGYGLTSTSGPQTAGGISTSINTMWGVIFAVFGGVMLYLSRRSRS